ncbi:unnamed protein product, partial [Sphenostylis stenocarpa]
MDTNDWVVLSDDSLFDVNEDCAEKQIYLGKRNLNSKGVFDVDDYYFCTSPKFKKTSEASRNFHPRVIREVAHIPIQLESRIGKAPDEGLVEENTKDHVEVTLVPSPITSEKIKEVVLGAGKDTVPQLFSKIREIESPKSVGRGLFISPDIGALKFEDIGGEAHEIMVSPRVKIERDRTIMDADKEVEDCSDGFNFWKWSLNGVGAICSFGVAAATICVLFFGSQQRNKFHRDQRIRFQVYTDDKRIKQMVQHATKLNEAAFSSMNGVPLSRARITCGGYYDGLDFKERLNARTKSEAKAVERVVASDEGPGAGASAAETPVAAITNKAITKRKKTGSCPDFPAVDRFEVLGSRTCPVVGQSVSIRFLGAIQLSPTVCG